MDLIGNTALVQLRNLTDGDSADIYSKIAGEPSRSIQRSIPLASPPFEIATTKICPARGCWSSGTVWFASNVAVMAYSPAKKRTPAGIVARVY